jgi:hypothetical protein
MAEISAETYAGLHAKCLLLSEFNQQLVLAYFSNTVTSANPDELRKKKEKAHSKQMENLIR